MSRRRASTAHTNGRAANPKSNGEPFTQPDSNGQPDRIAQPDGITEPDSNCNTSSD